MNTPHTAGELAAIRAAIDSGAPFGDADWRKAASGAIGWRPQGRPKKGPYPFFDGYDQKKGYGPFFQT